MDYDGIGKFLREISCISCIIPEMTWVSEKSNLSPQFSWFPPQSLKIQERKNSKDFANVPRLYVVLYLHNESKNA